MVTTNAQALLIKYLHTPTNEWYGPFMIILRDDEPERWYHEFGSPTHMHVPKTIEIVKNYGRCYAMNCAREHNLIADQFGCDVYNACWQWNDAIVLEYYKDVAPEPWDEWNAEITELGGWILPDGTYYECGRESHDGIAEIIYSLVTNKVQDNARRKVEEAGWLCVTEHQVHDYAVKITESQKVTVALILVSAREVAKGEHDFYNDRLDKFIEMLERQIARWQCNKN